jgi:hypothetical protein
MPAMVGAASITAGWGAGVGNGADLSLSAGGSFGAGNGGNVNISTGSAGGTRGNIVLDALLVVLVGLPTVAPATSGAVWRDAGAGNVLKAVP